MVDSGATLVVRPDSGDPVEIVARTLALLAERFGYEINGKGYKLLRQVRVLQGDGVNHGGVTKLLDRVMTDGFSLANVAFGMGGALLQRLDRDTQQFAYKASAVAINGVWRDIHKDPITDHGKRSKPGLLGLAAAPDYATIRVDERNFQPPVGGVNLLRPVYLNGRLLVDDTLEDVRARANPAA